MAGSWDHSKTCFKVGLHSLGLSSLELFSWRPRKVYTYRVANFLRDLLGDVDGVFGADGLGEVLARLPRNEDGHVGALLVRYLLALRLWDLEMTLDGLYGPSYLSSRGVGYFRHEGCS